MPSMLFCPVAGSKVTLPSTSGNEPASSACRTGSRSVDCARSMARASTARLVYMPATM